VIISFQTMAL